MKILTVIPLKKGVFKDELAYFSSKNIPIGSIVNIAVRNKKVLGLVIAEEDVTLAKQNIKNMDFNLKKVVEVKESSFFRPEFLDGALLCAKYFASRKSDAVASLIPLVLREEYDKVSFMVADKANNKNPNINNVKIEKLLFQAKLEDRVSYYKTLIRSTFALKKSVFIVLPTLYDIKNFESSLSKGIEQFTFSLHGDLKPKQILERIEKILLTEHPVLILATTPYLSIPKMDISTIILEHENSSAYKTFARPHIDMRIFVEIFASKIGAKLILGDSMLRFETISRKYTGDCGEVYPLSFRTNFGGEIEIIDRTSRNKEKGKFSIFADETLQNIYNIISRNKNVFVFSLRKGLATYTICRDCGDTVLCEKCMAPVVLYTSKDGKKRIFICNRCKNELETTTTCKSCNSWNLVPLGIGVDTVFDELAKNFTKTKILQLDKEIAKTEKGAQKIATEFEANQGAILVGTEMALFYLKNKVPVSVISSFDSLFSVPNYKISEKIIQLIFSVIEKTENKLIIETKNPNEEVLTAISSENLLHYMRAELEDRKTLGYPPFVRFIKIVHIGTKIEKEKAKSYLAENLAEYNPEIFSGLVSQTKGKYITNCLIKINPSLWSLPALTPASNINERLLEKLLSLPPSFSVMVDPENLL